MKKRQQKPRCVSKSYTTWLRGDDGHSTTGTLGDLLWGVSWLRLSSALAGWTTSRHDLLHEVFGFVVMLLMIDHCLFAISQWLQVWCKFGYVHIVELYIYVYIYIFHPWDISVVLKIIQDPTFPNWSLKHWCAAFECCGERPCDNVMLTWRSWTSRKKCGSDTLWRRMDVDG